MSEFAERLRMTAMRVYNDRPSPRMNREAADALYAAANRIERLERELTETAAALQKSLDFNDRANVLLDSIGKIMADATFDPSMDRA